MSAPDHDDNADKPVADDTADKLVADGTADKLVADGTTDKLVADGTADKLVADGTTDKLVADGTTDKLVADGTTDKLVADGTTDKLVADGTADKLVADDTADKLVADDTADKLVADDTADKLVADDTADKLVASVPPGIGDPQEQNEVGRIQERIAALTKQHEISGPSRQRRPPSFDQHADIEAEFATARWNEPDVDLPRGSWMRTLDPVMMPPPPQDKRALLSYGTVTGSIAAICVAAGIALAVTNSLQAPTADAAVASGADAGRSQSFSNTVLANLTQIPPAEARVQPVEPPATPALSAFSALLKNDSAPARSPDVISPPAQPGIAGPPAAAIPEPRATPTLSSDEVAAMLRRGRDLIAAGDIVSARLILQSVAEDGSAEASLILASTFDPVALSKLGVIGVRPDPAEARAWYARAADQGSPEAQQRLQQEALR